MGTKKKKKCVWGWGGGKGGTRQISLKQGCPKTLGHSERHFALTLISNFLVGRFTPSWKLTPGKMSRSPPQKYFQTNLALMFTGEIDHPAPTQAASLQQSNYLGPDLLGPSKKIYGHIQSRPI